jgi:hypothetical protein
MGAAIGIIMRRDAVLCDARRIEFPGERIVQRRELGECVCLMQIKIVGSS